MMPRGNSHPPPVVLTVAWLFGPRALKQGLFLTVTNAPYHPLGSPSSLFYHLIHDILYLFEQCLHFLWRVGVTHGIPIALRLAELVLEYSAVPLRLS